MIIDIRPIVCNGEHYVRVILGGQEMTRRGPYPTADEARNAAAQFSSP